MSSQVGQPGTGSELDGCVGTRMMEWLMKLSIYLLCSNTMARLNGRYWLPAQALLPDLAFQSRCTPPNRPSSSLPQSNAPLLAVKWVDWGGSLLPVGLPLHVSPLGADGATLTRRDSCQNAVHPILSVAYLPPSPPPTSFLHLH